MLPFKIDRSSGIKYTHQVADGLREAILRDYWKFGERLPSTRDMHEELGVSVRAPMEALRILAREGLISLREKQGAVVNRIRMPARLGRVLLVTPGGARLPGDMRFVEGIRMRLGAAGYTVALSTPFRLRTGGPYDFATLRVDLAQSLDLVVVQGSDPMIVREVSASGRPFVTVNGPPSRAKGCVGSLSISSVTAVTAFVEHCRQARVKRVWEILKSKRDPGVGSALREAGIRTRRWSLDIPFGGERIAVLQRRGFEAFERLFAEGGRTRLPDLLYFSDDYVFFGAAISMIYNRVRWPKDVRVVTVSNAGTQPTFRSSLTSIEFDSSADGDKAGAALVKYLETGRFPRRVNLGPVYRRGESFA